MGSMEASWHGAWGHKGKGRGGALQEAYTFAVAFCFACVLFRLKNVLHNFTAESLRDSIMQDNGDVVGIASWNVGSASMFSSTGNYTTIGRVSAGLDDDSHHPDKEISFNPQLSPSPLPSRAGRENAVAVIFRRLAIFHSEKFRATGDCEVAAEGPRVLNTAAVYSVQLGASADVGSAAYTRMEFEAICVSNSC